MSHRAALQKLNGNTTWIWPPGAAGGKSKPSSDREELDSPSREKEILTGSLETTQGHSAGSLWPRHTSNSEGQRKDRGVGQPKILQAPPRQENRCKLWWANARQVESHLDKQLTQGVQTSLRPSFKHIESREHGRELMGPRGGPSQRGPLEWMGPLKRRWVNYLHLSLIDHCFPRRNQ